MRILVLSVFGLVLAVPARADEPKVVPRNAVDVVVEAFRSGDLAQLRELASRDKPDPWHVVDELLDVLQHDAAAAFAKAAPRKDVEALPAYVESLRNVPPDAVRRKMLADTGQAHKARDLEAVLASSAGLWDSQQPVLALRLSWYRGLALRELKRTEESAAEWLRAGVTARKIGWLARASIAHRESGLLSLDAGDLDRTQVAWEGMLAVEEVRQNPVGLATALANVGYVFSKRGQAAEALPVLERARALAERSGDRTLIGRALANLAMLYADLGRYAEAFALHERTVAFCEAGSDAYGTALALTNFAALHARLGNVDDALAMIGRAMKSWDAAESRKGRADSLALFGDLELLKGRHARARELQEEAHRLHEENRDGVGAASALLNLGIIAAAERKDDEALELYARARARYVAAGVPTLAARIGSYVAGIHQRRGEFAQALEAEGLTLVEAERLGQVEDAVKAQAGIAETHLLAGAPERALEVARRAVERVPAVLRGLADEQTARARETFAGLYATGAEAAVLRGSAEELLYFLERGRAGALLAAFGGRDVLHAVIVPAPLRAREADARAKERVAAQALRAAEASGDPAAAAAARPALEAARREVVRTDEAMQRDARAAVMLTEPHPIGLPALRARLTPDEALVLYSLGRVHAAALVLTAGEARIVTLGAWTQRDDVEALAGLADRPATVGGGASPAPEKILEGLEAFWVAPLALGPRVRRVLVSPERHVGYFPFAALCGGREVALVPSGTTYDLLRSFTARGKGVLALGDPTYGPRSGSPLRAGPLVPLPATREEARAVGDVVLLGDQATEEGLRKALATRPRWRSLHLACHGHVDPERPTLSSLALTPTDADDGSWTALEVFRTPIPADLVVLSACETGRGRVYAGEGVVGLTRAFMFAGAPRVVVSLWKVDDGATRILMEAFHAEWSKGGKPAATALLHAQHRLRDFEEERVDPEASRAAGRDVRTKVKPYGSPWFWAGWSLWGLPD